MDRPAFADTARSLSARRADSRLTLHGGDPQRLSSRVAARNLAAVKSDFARDWDRLAVVALDDTTCKLAADLAETTGARTLDALHLAAASRAGAPVVRLVTLDARLAQVARSLGWSVVGA